MTFHARLEELFGRTGVCHPKFDATVVVAVGTGPDGFAFWDR